VINMATIKCDKCKNKISIAQWQVSDYIEQHGKICHNCRRKLEKEQIEGEKELLKKISEPS